MDTNSVQNVSVQATTIKPAKFQVNSKTNRSIIGDSTVNYTFKDASGNQKTYKLLGTTILDGFSTHRIANYNSFFTAFNKYSTDDNPEITPKELFQIKQDILKATNPSIDTDVTAQVADYFMLLDLYSNEYSENGKSITPTEQAEITSIFAKHWFDACNLKY